MLDVAAGVRTALMRGGIGRCRGAAGKVLARLALAGEIHVRHDLAHKPAAP
jgi:hypothetical protein